ncbi:uncharacterized protein LOC124594579 [Schistocerca americana]|uniref:uncharacterized protein LOC124594579 n=1 Tax=Schistocerca americana TaxID=7009 RepID=UPI001F4F3BB2|nr:uncharacterized protein LOC124594579 [Schistocerca americana]
MSAGSGLHGGNPVSTPEINKVSVKLPPYWVEKPNIWFCQAETQFTIAASATKFNYPLARFEPKYVETIWDLVSSDENNKYSLAKERLLTIFKENEDHKIKKKCGLELGDMKPSQLLRKNAKLCCDQLVGIRFKNIVAR